MQVLDIEFQAFSPIEDPATPKEVRVSVGKMALNLNDNFLLLLSSLVEHHLQDVINF
jgi:hypothetical protein